MAAVWTLLAVLLCAAPSPAGRPAPLIVVDPGHGGTQAGAASAGGQLEKHLALALARQLRAILQRELGARVVLTRDADVLMRLSERVELANAQRPDLFLSIHANSMPTKKQRELNSGIETYFLSAAASGEAAQRVAARENAEAEPSKGGPGGDSLAFILADLQRAEAHADSSRLAYGVQEALVSQTGAVDRGVQQAPFYVLMGLEAPAVLIELGFLSHPREGKRLADPEYQAKLAFGIAKGVKSFLDENSARERGRPDGGQ